MKAFDHSLILIIVFGGLVWLSQVRPWDNETYSKGAFGSKTQSASLAQLLIVSYINEIHQSNHHES